MASVDLKSVSVDLAVYNPRGRALKTAILAGTVGGRIKNAADPGIKIISALQDVSFSVRDGERVGLVGGNGAGKTTLLRVLSGAYPPTGGDCVIQGKTSSLIDLAMGMDSESTGYENIVMRGVMLGLTRKQAAGLTDDVAEFSELGEFLDLPIRTYSSGMLLRLAFAVCTAIKPEILVLDEVIGVGDAAFADKAKRRIGAMIQQSNIMFLASHDNTTIREFCNRVIWLKEGRVEMDGSADAVIEAYAGSSAA